MIMGIETETAEIDGDKPEEGTNANSNQTIGSKLLPPEGTSKISEQSQSSPTSTKDQQHELSLQQQEDQQHELNPKDQEHELNLGALCLYSSLPPAPGCSKGPEELTSDHDDLAGGSTPSRGASNTPERLQDSTVFIGGQQEQLIYGLMNFGSFWVFVPKSAYMSYGADFESTSLCPTTPESQSSGSLSSTPLSSPELQEMHDASMDCNFSEDLAESACSSSSSDVKNVADINSKIKTWEEYKEKAENFLLAALNKRPSEDEQIQQRLRAVQLLPSDENPESCRFLRTARERTKMEEFAKHYKEARGVGEFEEMSFVKDCTHCRQAIEIGERVVLTEKVGPMYPWHPHCFSCYKCREYLADLTFFYDEDTRRIYCGRHYSELSHPRCVDCDELIFADKMTRVESRSWHYGHSRCQVCDLSLGNMHIIMVDDGQLFCPSCYEQSAIPTCFSCKTIISPKTHTTFAKKGRRYFHALPECFKCWTCGVYLDSQPCMLKRDMLFCSPKCVGEMLPNRRKKLSHKPESSSV